MPVEALETGQPQAIVRDIRDHAPARQQRNAATRVGKHATDKAADAAGSSHADRQGCIHAAFIPLIPLLRTLSSIAESLFCGYRSPISCAKLRRNFNLEPAL